MRHVVRPLSIAVVLAAVFASPSSAQSPEPFQIGAVSMSYVTRTSKAGQAAIAAIDAFGKQKSVEVEGKAAELQRQQLVLQKQSAAMSPRAVADLQRGFEKSRLEFERFQQDAEADVRAMQAKFDAEFRVKLAPIIDAVCKEKGLHFVFGLEQSTMIVWWSPAVNISEEVVKRLDAAP
jgi:Skp family chaperone for outer membrane proteins